MKRNPFVALAMCAALVSHASAQVVLWEGMPEGKTQKLETTTKIDQILTIGGMEIPTSVTATERSVRSYGAKDADGNFPFANKREAINLMMSIPNVGEFSFDSTDAKADGGDNPLFKMIAEIQRAMIENEMKFVVDGNRKVLSVSGHDKILNELSPEAQQVAKFQLDGDKLKKELEQGLNLIPTKPLKAGDTWESTEVASVGLGETLTFHKEYKYVGTVEKDGKTLDKIEGTTKAIEHSQDPAAAAQAKISNSQLKPESSKDEILFDRKERQIVQNSAKVHMTGTMTLTVNGMDLEAKLDLNIETSVATK